MSITIKNVTHFKQILERLQETSGVLEKVAILASAIEHNTQLVQLFRLALDPFIQYYLTSEKACKKGRPGKKTYNSTYLDNPFRALACRRVTGDAACDMWIDFVRGYGAEFRPVLNSILDKDLSCHVGVKTFNKVMEHFNLDLLPDYEVALGYPMNEKHGIDEEARYYISRKLDGVRCQAFISTKESPILLSRQGKAFDTMDFLIEALHGYKGPSFVLDGELALHTKDGLDDFSGLMKQLRKKNHTIENIRFHVFDCLTPSEFLGKTQSVNFCERIERIRRTLNRLNNNPHFCAVPQHLMKNNGTLLDWIAASRVRNWEGLILRKDAPYVRGRSDDILKVKEMQDLEAVVEDVKMGEMTVTKNGKDSTIPILAAAIIKYKGCAVGVGSGWSLEDRILYHKHPEKLMGRTLTVCYFEETRNKSGGYGLRFPVVKLVHEGQRTT